VEWTTACGTRHERGRCADDQLTIDGRKNVMGCSLETAQPSLRRPHALDERHTIPITQLCKLQSRADPAGSVGVYSDALCVYIGCEAFDLQSKPPI